jgi:hypothetical protein
MMKKNRSCKCRKQKKFFVIHCFMCLQCPITYVYEKWTTNRPGTSMKKVKNQKSKWKI